MAKGARASTNKANNQKLKANVFGPVENARTERLSAKLLELASQPRPKSQPKPAKDDIDMEGEGDGQSRGFYMDLTPSQALQKTPLPTPLQKTS